MTAPKGNKFWKKRTKHGAPRLFEDPEILWDACNEYFDWVDENPLWEHKVAQYQGVPVSMEVPKMRAMTLDGLYTFLGISFESWRRWRTEERYQEVIEKVERVIRDYKFAGAAADLLNSNLIARDLGLTDKQEIKNSHSFAELTEDELNNKIKQLEDELKAKD